MTTDYKTTADRLHDRLIGDIEANDRRNHATVTLPLADLRRAARSLDARAEGLLVRRDRDPILRDAANREAAHCRRLAALLLDLARGAE
ncbi:MULTISPECIES: hypothetical protein [unclassified Acidiphilium]|uniref:hypothetical protein n=1 Tax=unclassified Acidiphilium TaxID=2617493 RepID=UPI000BC4DF86|nr:MULTISPECIES: hypothetical protein [unclassified Acidiphilium]OYV57457.1 MAG: hypothetical protein B7Z76_01395 [Acidiphilium sp. 20-67-58]HQT59677.1 hypothetical protein [Acidiphilium sp.]